MNDLEGGFFSRWSRRKALVREGAPLPAEPTQEAPRQASPALPTPPPAPVHPTPAGATTAASPAEPPAPTLAEAQALTAQSDFTRFVAPEVDPAVRNAALKRLFSDGHFNVMDGLDVYIDDYGKPDPLPPGMLRRLAQSRALGLFADDEPAHAQQADATPPAMPDGPDVPDVPDVPKPIDSTAAAATVASAENTRCVDPCVVPDATTLASADAVTPGAGTSST